MKDTLVTQHTLCTYQKGATTGSEHFAGQGIGLSQIFKLIVSTSAKRLENINVVV